MVLAFFIPFNNIIVPIIIINSPKKVNQTGWNSPGVSKFELKPLMKIMFLYLTASVYTTLLNKCIYIHNKIDFVSKQIHAVINPIINPVINCHGFKCINPKKVHLILLPSF